LARGLRTVEEHATESRQNSGKAQSAAERAENLRNECNTLAQALRAKAGEVAAAWDEVRQSLANLSASAEQSASKAADFSQKAQQAASECRAAADQNRELNTTLQAEHQETRQRVAAWLREAETHANAALQNGNLASAASELTSSLKAECEELTRSLRTQASELTDNWVKIRESLAALSNLVEQNSARASESSQAAQQHLGGCQTSAQAIQQMRAGLQTEFELFSQRAARLEEMLQQCTLQMNTGGEHLDACQRLHSQIVETESRLKSYKQTVEDQLRLAQQARQESELLKSEIKDQLVTLQLNSGSFWKRLKWVLLG
jgi:hypothetical protein